MDNNKVLSNAIWKLAERLLAQLVSLSVSIVLARILSPSDYGSVAIVMIFITVANIFVTEGLPSALIQRKEVTSIDYSSVFYFNFFVSVFLYSVLFAFAPLIARFYSDESLVLCLRVLGLRLIVASFNSIQHSFVSRNLMFRKYFWSTLIGTVISGIIGILLAIWGFGVWALIMQYMINTCVDTIFLFFTVNWRPTREFSIGRIKDFFSYGWKLLFESLSNCVDSQIRNVIIGKVYSASDLAFYEKGASFPNIVTNNICVSISSVLFPVMSKSQDNEEELVQIMRKTSRLSYYVVFPMLVGLATVAPNLILVLLGEKWNQVVPYLQLFCVSSMAVVGMYPRHQALKGKGRSDIYMIEHVFSRVVGLILLIMVYRISPMAILLASLVSTAILTAIIVFTSSRYTGYRVIHQIQDVLPASIGVLIMGVVVYFCGKIQLSCFVVLGIQIIVGAAVYVLYSVITKNKEFVFLMNYLKGFFMRRKK